MPLTEATIELIKYAKDRGLNDAQLAYVLATVDHETGGEMKPVREKYDGTPQEYFRDYGGGWRYFGRGMVQVTHDYNYRWGSEELRKHGMNIDLLHNPDFLLRDTPQSRRANAILAVEGMMQGQYGRPLTNYVNDQKQDFYNARRSVNSADKPTYGSIANKVPKYLESIDGYYQEVEAHNDRVEQLRPHRQNVRDTVGQRNTQQYQDGANVQNQGFLTEMGGNFDDSYIQDRPSNNPFTRGK